jgi:hyperosmotically inducible protein
MLRRLFALLVLAVLVLTGLYYWKTRSPMMKVAAPESLHDVGQTLQDAAVTGAVKTAFQLNRRLKPLSIDVHTEDKVVTLRGDVPSGELKDTAERVAQAVPEVRQVVNHLRVKGGGEAEAPRPDRTLSETLDDQALEVQVRLALSLNKDLKGSDLTVDAFKKAVTLSGRARSDRQKALAEQVARDTAGVSGVTNNVRVPD